VSQAATIRVRIPRTTAASRLVFALDASTRRRTHSTPTPWPRHSVRPLHPAFSGSARTSIPITSGDALAYLRGREGRLTHPADASCLGRRSHDRRLPDERVPAYAPGRDGSDRSRHRHAITAATTFPFELWLRAASNRLGHNVIDVTLAYDVVTTEGLGTLTLVTQDVVRL
jgi:hypothetical protein